MASPIKSVTVSINSDNSRTINWNLVAGYNYPSDFTLYVENSREADKWLQISPDMHEACYFVDTTRRNWNKHMDEYYRIHLKAGTENYYSEAIPAGYTAIWPFSSEAKAAIGNIEEAIRMSGVTGVLLKRKVFGTRCPRCTDFSGQASVNEHCPICLGTGIEGGYYPGITLNITKDQIQSAAGLQQVGAGQLEIVQGRCIAYPWITTGDIWCEDTTNYRYRIAACQPASTYKTTTLVYTLKLNRLEYTDVLYTKEADTIIVAKDQWTAPNADYSKPTDTVTLSWKDAFK